MEQKRRRWWTALGLVLATALGGVLAYLFARRRRRAPSPEDASVIELSVRLREEAAAQERRVRRQCRQSCRSRLWRRRMSPPDVLPEEGQGGDSPEPLDSLPGV